MATHANRVQMTVSGTPGTGTITLGSASSGYRSFATAYGADATVDVLITEGTSWEVARGCAYTNSGTTLGRGTLESSSTGSAVAFTSAAIVSVIATADFGNRLERAMQAVMPGGRLTLESGVPVSTTDQTAKTTIYYTPYVHDTIPLWDGAKWVPTTFAETSEALGTLTSGLPYDVFGFLSSGVLDLEKLAWTDGTTRATAVTLQDGRYCKSGDKTRLYLGTFYTTSTTTTEDSGFGSTTAPSKRYVWNAYNRVKRTMLIEEDTSSWTWTGTGSTLRQWRAQTDNQVEAVVGLPGQASISLEINCTHTNSASAGASAINIGYDSTTAMAANSMSFYGAAFAINGVTPMHAHLEMVVPVGRHYWAMLEENVTAGNTVTMYGTLSPHRRSGMVGWIEA